MVMQYIGIPFDMIPIMLVLILHRRNLQAVEEIKDLDHTSVESFISQASHENAKNLGIPNRPSRSLKESQDTSDPQQ